MKNKKLLNRIDKILFDKIIEEATVDCYSEYEQIAGWACVFEDNLFVPCKCSIGKERAILEKIDTNNNSTEIFGVIKLNKSRIRVPIEDVSFEDFDFMKYTEAYKYWKKHG